MHGDCGCDSGPDWEWISHPLPNDGGGRVATEFTGQGHTVVLQDTGWGRVGDDTGANCRGEVRV